MKKEKIIFLTDFSPNQNGYAGPQTTYNFIKLFDKHEYIIFVNATHHKEMLPNKEWEMDKHYHLFDYFFRYSTTNRLNAACNFIKLKFNPRFYFPPKKTINIIKAFNPDSIVCITNSAFIYKVASVFKKMFPKINLFFYIMDDYKHYEKPYLQKSIDKIFNKSKAWIAISDSMVNLFQDKFPSLQNKPKLIVQNPVEMSGIKLKVKKNQVQDKIKIVYAGSVYPNHKDGLLNVIDAVNQSQILELIIYTKPEFRHSFVNKESSNVVYKGNISYKELLKTLENYDYGLITESFLPEFSNFSKSSIQTKTNDYILSGCLPVVIGPDYGACINNVRINSIGHTLSTNDSHTIQFFLESFINDTNYDFLITSAQSYLKKKLSEVKKNVVEFIAN